MGVGFFYEMLLVRLEIVITISTNTKVLIILVFWEWTGVRKTTTLQSQTSRDSKQSELIENMSHK